MSTRFAFVKREVVRTFRSERRIYMMILCIDGIPLSLYIGKETANKSPINYRIN
jgi:hypothetical protein